MGAADAILTASSADEGVGGVVWSETVIKCSSALLCGKDAFAPFCENEHWSQVDEDSGAIIVSRFDPLLVSYEDESQIDQALIDSRSRRYGPHVVFFCSWRNGRDELSGASETKRSHVSIG